VVDWPKLRDSSLLGDLPSEGYAYQLVRPDTNDTTTAAAAAAAAAARGVRRSDATSATGADGGVEATTDEERRRLAKLEYVLAGQDHPVAGRPVSISADVLGTPWTLDIAPASGSWAPTWRDPMIGAVVAASLAAGVLLMVALKAQHQHYALLRRMLPERVIRRLRGAALFYAEQQRRRRRRQRLRALRLSAGGGGGGGSGPGSPGGGYGGGSGAPGTWLSHRLWSLWYGLVGWMDPPPASFQANDISVHAGAYGKAAATGGGGDAHHHHHLGGHPSLHGDGHNPGPPPPLPPPASLPPAYVESVSSATVLFSDIVSYTSLAASMAPEAIVAMLNEVFSAYESICSEERVHKVETIGDGFMAVAGGQLGDDDDDGRGGGGGGFRGGGGGGRRGRGGKDKDGDCGAVEAAERAAALALRMVQVTAGLALTERISIRVGLHSGPVVAAVVGRSVPRLSFFGDTVNTASRMETASLPGFVHLSEATARLLALAPRGRWDVQPRGEIQVKGKGVMRTYFLHGYDPGPPSRALTMTMAAAAAHGDGRTASGFSGFGAGASGSGGSDEYGLAYDGAAAAAAASLRAQQQQQRRATRAAAGRDLERGGGGGGTTSAEDEAAAAAGPSSSAAGSAFSGGLLGWLRLRSLGGSATGSQAADDGRPRRRRSAASASSPSAAGAGRRRGGALHPPMGVGPLQGRPLPPAIVVQGSQPSFTSTEAHATFVRQLREQQQNEQQQEQQQQMGRGAPAAAAAGTAGAPSPSLSPPSLSLAAAAHAPHPPMSASSRPGSTALTEDTPTAAARPVSSVLWRGLSGGVGFGGGGGGGGGTPASVRGASQSFTGGFGGLGAPDARWGGGGGGRAGGRRREPPSREASVRSMRIGSLHLDTRERYGAILDVATSGVSSAVGGGGGGGGAGSASAAGPSSPNNQAASAAEGGRRGASAPPRDNATAAAAAPLALSPSIGTLNDSILESHDEEPDEDDGGDAAPGAGSAGSTGRATAGAGSSDDDLGLGLGGGGEGAIVLPAAAPAPPVLVLPGAADDGVIYAGASTGGGALLPPPSPS
jgi:class 3 adenylate cyclase